MERNSGIGFVHDVVRTVRFRLYDARHAEGEFGCVSARIGCGCAIGLAGENLTGNCHIKRRVSVPICRERRRSDECLSFPVPGWIALVIPEEFNSELSIRCAVQAAADDLNVARGAGQNRKILQVVWTGIRVAVDVIV